MKFIKAATRLLIGWAVVLFLLFGTPILYKVSSASNEIQSITELNQYSGYKVRKLKTDWFGNWIIAKKGQDEVVLKCSDSIFSQLSVDDYLGK